MRDPEFRSKYEFLADYLEARAAVLERVRQARDYIRTFVGGWTGLAEPWSGEYEVVDYTQPSDSAIGSAAFALWEADDLPGDTPQ
jgi:hypothetical protein